MKMAEARWTLMMDLDDSRCLDCEVMLTYMVEAEELQCFVIFIFINQSAIREDQMFAQIHAFTPWDLVFFLLTE